MDLYINNEFTEWFYCQKHGKWNLTDDENNCCAREKGGIDLIKCPKCGSSEVYAFVTLRLVVKVNTSEFEDGPIERYEDGIFDELNCDDCDHFWLPNH